MSDVWVQECHDVECLHHIRTVGARQRDISLQCNASLQCTNATGNGFIRKIFPFPSALSTASINEVNSCPLGIPRKVMPVGLPLFNRLNSSLGVSVVVSWHDSLSEDPAKSFKTQSAPEHFHTRVGKWHENYIRLLVIGIYYEVVLLLIRLTYWYFLFQYFMNNGLLLFKTEKSSPAQPWSSNTERT